ncbi:endonuclease IV [archaeon BMS3Bbin15]|nr:endonuclease IV [archaeon BMS3Bbin15]
MKLAVSSLAYMKRPYTEFIILAEKMDFESVELILDGHHIKENFGKLGEVIDSYSLDMSIHAPFSDLNIASLNTRIRSDSLEQIKSAMEVAVDFEADTFTFHPGRLSPYSVLYEDKAWDMNVESIKYLYSEAMNMDLNICIENMPEGYGAMLSSPEDVERLIDSLGDISFTFDIGHACTGEGAIKMIKTMGKNIKNIHIHDNCGEMDEHLAVGDGKINFRSIFSNLNMYRGNFVIEVHKEEDVLRSKEKIYKLTGA